MPTCKGITGNGRVKNDFNANSTQEGLQYRQITSDFIVSSIIRNECNNAKICLRLLKKVENKLLSELD